MEEEDRRKITTTRESRREFPRRRPCPERSIQRLLRTSRSSLYNVRLDALWGNLLPRYHIYLNFKDLYSGTVTQVGEDTVVLHQNTARNYVTVRAVE